MKKIIILDFNRTIYDPETKELVLDTKAVLHCLLRRNFELYLISHGNNSRKSLINDLGINQYFKHIIITPGKTRKDFQQLIKQNIDLRTSFVIGDRIRQEIAFGNLLGMQTIWIRNGKFSNETPRNKNEQPDYTVRTLKNVLRIIC